MKSRFLLILLLATAKIGSLKAQERHLTLEEVVTMALQNSNASKIAESRVKVAEGELKTTKSLQYPDANISGQYMYLSNPDVELQFGQGSGASDGEDSGEGGDMPKVNQLMIGQANVSMPIFSGFKLKNLVKASEASYQAAFLNAQNEQEQIALQSIQLYVALYKATQTIGLVEENLKSAQQRVTDFTNMMDNGLLAKNDLLKAQLQEANISVSLAEAKKNRKILNSRLAKLLQLEQNTKIDPVITEVGILADLSVERKDLEALNYRKEAAQDQIKVAQSAYYPSLAINGGYIALDVKNALTVKNAMNVGVGVSYNLASIFKNKEEVKLAKAKAQELDYQIEDTKDKIELQVENAQDEYQLALEKLETYSKSEEQAIENYRIVKDKYDNGLQDTNDLLEADVQQLQARIDLAYAKANIAEKYYELQAATGHLKQQFTK